MKEHEEKKEHSMGKKNHGAKHMGMGKKEAGFGAKLGKHKMGKGPEGPHEGMKK